MDRQNKKENKLKMMIEVWQQMKPVVYNQCPETDTKPKDQWATRKAEQHLQAETNDDDDDESVGLTEIYPR